MGAEERLREMGIVLPPPWKDAPNRLRALKVGKLVYMGGHGPLDRDLRPLVRGKVGGELTVEQGYDAARLAAIALLGTLKGCIGDLDRVRRFVKVLGFVNCAEGFHNPPAVMHGFSDFIVQVFGEAGRHTRSAIGVYTLYEDTPVEVEATVQIA